MKDGSYEADEKAEFFDELYALDQLSEDEVGTNGIQHVSKNRITLDASTTFEEAFHAAPAIGNVSKVHGIRRTASQPTPIQHDPCLILEDNSARLHHLQTPSGSTIVPSTMESSKREASLPIDRDLCQARPPHRTVSAPTSSVTTSIGEVAKSSIGKRKRKEPPLKYVPEARQIFLGCNFFFIPNDDIAPMRRARIRKAQEHGAVWYSEWGNEITHIIVDKSLSYDDIISFLRVASIPKDMIMTNDIYPIDCIQFKAILNPNQKQYRVKGHDEALQEKGPQQSPSDLLKPSLELNPAQLRPGKWDYFPPGCTPPRSEASPQTFPNAPPLEPQLNNMSANTAIEALNIEAIGISREDRGEPLEKSPTLSIYTGAEIEEGDALDEMIKEARLMMHLPLDDEYFDWPPSRDKTPEKDDRTYENNSGSPSKPRVAAMKNLKKGAFDQKNFSCMKVGSGTTDTSNPNSRTISILQEMADYYTRINDTWRPIAYRKAISTLRQQSTKITTSEEAFALPCVGRRLALKIEEIVTTDHLRRLEYAKTEPTDHILQRFMGIYGVGFCQANKWLHSGYTTLEDLKEHADLTENQLLGIEHYDDFHTRIPREEVTALGEIVKATAYAIDPKVEIIVGGSYRRGATTSGDIDCIITKQNTSSSNDIFAFFTELISMLKSSNFLVASLAVPRAESGTKWQGCCILPGAAKPVWRRIDFLLVPASELGAALIYFTGNDIFNRSIRLLASIKGMRLNQKGLYKDVMRGPKRAKLNEGELIEGADERKIFEALGVPWRPPEQRVC